MAQECMGIFEKDKLSQVANVEQVPPLFTCYSCLVSVILVQCSATGMTVEGKSPKTLVEEMVPLLDSRETM